MITSNHKVAVSSISFSKSPALREKLLSIFPNCIFNKHERRLSGQQLADFILSDAYRYNENEEPTE